MKNLNRREFLQPMAASATALFAARRILASAPSLPSEMGQKTIFSVRKYGAKGDKVSDDTPAIQAAIDACNRSGGGEVFVPPGNYFSGGIILKSNVTLRLENGATIWASGNIKDYHNKLVEDHAYFIEALGQENLVVCGEGKFIGTGQGDLRRRTGEESMPMPRDRFGIILFTGCKNVRLQDFGIRYSEAHTVMLRDCEDVFVDGVSILNNYFRTETDGIDPDSCKNVLISNCHISAGDDAICLKTDHGKPLENVVVDNCILESVATAIKLGTSSTGDFRDIRVSNCVIRNSTLGIGLFIKDGGTVEGAGFSNLVIETTRQDVPVNNRLRNDIYPIWIDLTKRNPNSPLSRVCDVSFDDIQIASDNSVVIQGMPQREIENVSLRGINFYVNGAFDFSHRIEAEGGESTYSDANKTRFVRQPTYVALAYIRGLTVHDVDVTIPTSVMEQFPRSAVAVFNSQDGVIRNIRCDVKEIPNAPPAVVLKNCRAVAVEDER